MRLHGKFNKKNSKGFIQSKGNLILLISVFGNKIVQKNKFLIYISIVKFRQLPNYQIYIP